MSIKMKAWMQPIWMYSKMSKNPGKKEIKLNL